MSVMIRKAAVLGAGVMGSAIAAHFAGAGIQTELLDIVPPDLGDAEKQDPKARNRFAQTGLERALAAKPAAFYDTDAARLIRVGNLEDHLDRLGDCDLVIEAVVENLSVKRALFEKIAPKLAPHAMLASNTSGLSIAGMSEALPGDLAKRFVVMHFFNPVRYMRLLELAPGPKTDPAVLKQAAVLGEALGKGIVWAKDTPNFVANRIGVYAMMLTMHEMLKAGLSVEVVDKIVGKPMGRPKSAAFDTADIVGIDTLVHVAKNCYESLEKDEERELFKLPDFVTRMIQEKRLGRKSGGGFYKKVGDEIKVLDLGTFDYRSQEKVRFESLGAIRNEEDPKKRLKALIGFDDLAHASLQRAAPRRDRGRHRQHRSRHALGLQLGPRPVRGLGRDRRARERRAHEEGRPRGARVGDGHARLGSHQLLRRRPGDAALLRPEAARRGSHRR
jgi:3-hydroxyacyl-CoA dehydrogenase